MIRPVQRNQAPVRPARALLRLERGRVRRHLLRNRTGSCSCCQGLVRCTCRNRSALSPHGWTARHRWHPGMRVVPLHPQSIGAMPMSAPQGTAAMDPWTLLMLAGGERSLFGFCLRHHGLCGLSWVLSTPVVHLDEGAGVARTRSATLYLLGRRVSVDELSDYEARVALRELGGPRNPDSAHARLWLTACKTARWLGLPAPAWYDPVGVEAFLERHRAAYYDLRAERASTGRARRAD